MMGTGETLTMISERKPQSERDALAARAAVQWRLVKCMVQAYRAIPLKVETQELWKSKRELAREYLGMWSRTRAMIRELGK